MAPDSPAIWLCVPIPPIIHYAFCCLKKREVRFLATRRLWECKTNHAKRQFSIKVGTIFEDSPLGLDKWLPAVWMIANDKNGISSAELARAIGVTQKSAWFMLHRIRLAMSTGTFRRMSGEDEGSSRWHYRQGRCNGTA